MAAPHGLFDALVDAGWLRVLSPSALRVLMILFRHMNKNTREAWPDIDRMVRVTGLGRSTIYQALGELRMHRLITSELAQKRGKFRAYTVELHRLTDQIPQAPSIVQEPRQYPEEQTVSSKVASEPGLESSETPLPERRSSTPTVQFKDKDKSIGTVHAFSSSKELATNGQRKIFPPSRGIPGFVSEILAGGGVLDERVMSQIRAYAQREGVSEADLQVAIREAEKTRAVQ